MRLREAKRGRGVALGRKRLVGCLWLALGWVAHSAAQSPYPATAVPQPAYGGFIMPESVPYQPTLVDPACDAPVVIVPESFGPPPGPYSQLVPTSMPYPQTMAPQPPDVQIPTAGQPTSGRAPWFPGGGRNGVFQKIQLTADYLPRFEDDSLGMTDAQLDIVFGLPLITRETPLLITPFYGIHWMDGPDSPDVPPRLHDAAVTLQHFRPLNDNWLVMLDLTMGQFADDVSFSSGEAFRITGGGAGVWRPTDRWKVVLGATYVNRASTQILPVAGIIYTPNDDAEYRLVFPAPKLSWRLPWTDVPGLDERWFYLAGEFGGGAWAVERADGTADRLDITDWRIYLGVERKIVGGLSRRLELGYVFSRTLEYETGGQIHLDDTLMLRAGLTY